MMRICQVALKLFLAAALQIEANVLFEAEVSCESLEGDCQRVIQQVQNCLPLPR